ncbi:MAG: hypothetical protein CMK30_07875 [Porticoccaceae bacterium]|nr:hypothetical protein [Porticoccaceae bacterium]
MRIVSLLPSATDLIYGLGLRHKVVGGSQESNYSISFIGLHFLTGTHISEDSDSALIYELVAVKLRSEYALYALDPATFVNFRPDLIVIQTLCNVRAVSGNDDVRASGAPANNSKVVNPQSGRLNNFKLVAAAVNRADKGGYYFF